MEDYSLFSWADRGQWETVQTENREIIREGDWFRIGFEPLFVDYTKRGTWFIVISLVEVGWCSGASTCGFGLYLLSDGEGAPPTLLVDATGLPGDCATLLAPPVWAGVHSDDSFFSPGALFSAVITLIIY